jgi:hypothetical protein
VISWGDERFNCNSLDDQFCTSCEDIWRGIIEAKLHSFLTLSLDEGNHSTSHPGLFVSLVPVEQEADWAAV